MDNKGIISPDEMQDIIDHCETLEQKALFSILYLTGARISELCNSYKRDVIWNKDEQKIEHTQYKGSRNGILKKDVSVVGNDVVINLPVRKKRSKTDRRDTPDEHTLVISVNAPFMNYFLDHLDEVEYEDMPVFDFTTRTAQKWIKAIDDKVGANGVYCHLFRKTRLTQISKISESEEDIRQWAGHSDTRSLKKYIALRPISKFKDKIK